MKNFKIVISIIAVGLIALVFWSLSNSDGSKFKNNDGLGEVAIIVNGQNIYKTEFDKIYESVVLSYGLDIDSLDEITKQDIKESVIEYLINQKVLLIAAEQAGTHISDEDLDFRIQEIKNMFDTEDDFLTTLELEGLDYDSFIIVVKNDMIANKYVENQIDLSDIWVDELDVTNLYNSLINSENENVPTLEEIYENLENMLMEERAGEMLGALIEFLRADAEIEILLN